ncbi:hypothetical protein D3C79_1026140 [compost metagenome]
MRGITKFPSGISPAYPIIVKPSGFVSVRNPPSALGDNTPSCDQISTTMMKTLLHFFIIYKPPLSCVVLLSIKES